MIKFILSFILLTASSLFFSYAVMKNQKKANLYFIYYLLIYFAQIVLTFELMSLLNAISAGNFLICNFLFLTVSIISAVKSKGFNPKTAIKSEFSSIIKALKRDKILFFISICFIVFIISELAIVILFPITFVDALSYYLPRCTSWIQNGNINHFITPDTRETIMPVNLEFCYSWALLFLKSERGLSVFSYISLLGAIYAIYNFLGELGFCRRKRLWAVFVFSSFALIGVMGYTPCADLFIGTLLLFGVYLFLNGIKYENKSTLFISSLSCALAIGTKTTAIIAMPSIFILCFIICNIYNRSKKNILYFSILFLINFLIFSSYNYILNFIEYANPVSCREQLLINKFRDGFKGYFATLIKYLFALFDFSGIENFDFYNNFITKVQSIFLSPFGEMSNTSKFFKDIFKYNSEIGLGSSFLGAMGLLAFIPSLILSFVNSKKKSPKTLILASLSLMFFLNIMIFARVMVYTCFNLRYLITFVVIASPVLVLSYIKSNKNIYKYMLLFVMIIYLFIIPHTKPTAFLITYEKYKKNNPSIKNVYEKVINITRDE